jgi:hypothetical protein
MVFCGKLAAATRQIYPNKKIIRWPRRNKGCAGSDAPRRKQLNVCEQY